MGLDFGLAFGGFTLWPSKSRGRGSSPPIPHNLYERTTSMHARGVVCTFSFISTFTLGLLTSMKGKHVGVYRDHAIMLARDYTKFYVIVVTFLMTFSMDKLTNIVISTYFQVIQMSFIETKFDMFFAF